MKIWLYLPLLIIFSGCAQADTQTNLKEDTYCQVINKIINLPALQQYFHIDIFPERSPLFIKVYNFTGSCAQLRKFGKQVKIINNSNSPKHIFLEISITNTTPTTFESTFSYKPEGIKGKVKLKKEKSKWLISESRIVEM